MLYHIVSNIVLYIGSFQDEEVLMNIWSEVFSLRYSTRRCTATCDVSKYRHFLHVGRGVNRNISTNKSCNT